LPVQRTCVEANALRGKFIGKSPSDKPWAFGTRCRSRTACQKTFPKLEEPALDSMATRSESSMDYQRFTNQCKSREQRRRMHLLTFWNQMTHETKRILKK
jgi:hypothetical protein